MAELGPGPWKVFLSHTSELRRYPEDGYSYIHKSEQAVTDTGHVPVCMRGFPSID